MRQIISKVFTVDIKFRFTWGESNKHEYLFKMEGEEEREYF